MNAVLDAPETSRLTPMPRSKLLSPGPIRWTVSEFYKLFELPDFQDRTFILLDGEILEMPNPGPLHVGMLEIVDDLLKRLFGAGYSVRNQGGLPLGLDIEPVPDLAVVTGTARDYLRTHPTLDKVRLVVEISDSTLSIDIRTKAHLYAAAGIPEYWVLDLNASKLHVFREPVADSTVQRGFRFASVRALTPGDQIAPLALPGSTIAVAEMLP